MPLVSRRAVLRDAAGFGAAVLLAGCVSSTENRPAAKSPVAAVYSPPVFGEPNYALMYAPITTEPFPVNGIDLTKIDHAFLRRDVDYQTDAPINSVVVDPQAHYLYYITSPGRAVRYGVGVGKEGFSWSGIATINSKQEWPDWYPPAEMIARRPDIQEQLTDLQSGRGVKGGPGNPIGARGMYLWQNGKDTLFRIHGTIEPYSIGKSVSSGCIRMINQDAIDLYDRVPVGTRVVVLS